MVDDDFETSALAPRHKAALAFSDAFFAAAGPPSAAAQTAISAQFTDAEIAEMGIGLALFHGFSKLLIAVGAEPTQMDITVLRTPGSPSEK